MSGRSSRAKGQHGERQFFELCNDAVSDLPWPYRRRDGKVFFRHPAPRHGKGQPDNSDPHAVLPVSIEVKRVEKPQFMAWINKLQDQVRDGQVPVLAWRKNHKPWVVMPLMDETEWRNYLRWKLNERQSEVRASTEGRQGAARVSTDDDV